MRIIVKIMDGISSLFKNVKHISLAIETCLEKKLHIPALILIYSGIDTFGWLASKEEKSSKKSFLNWVEKYLLKYKRLECSSLDLYAARCGLVHTSSPDSSLSNSGKARRICYAWGNAKINDLGESISITEKSTEFVAVHVNELYEAWQLGVLNFIDDINNDIEMKAAVCSKSNKFFTELGVDVVSEFLNRHVE